MRLIILALALSGCAASQPQEKWPTLEDGIAKSKALSKQIGEGWEAACQKDKITDKVACTITQNDSNILILTNLANRPTSICVFSHNFPGRRGAIRVDKNAAIITNTDGCIPAEPTFSQMKTGATITTQHVKWPYDYPVDASGPLAGLGSALNQLSERRAKPE